jgi:serine protease Do
MWHKSLFCVLLLSIAASAQPSERWDGGGAENWTFNMDEGGGSAYMGVDIADVTPERLTALKLKEEHGAEVTMVDADAPAGKAGLHEHDVILTLNGSEIESAAQLRRMIKETPAGRVVTLGISRDGQPMTIKVQLANRKKDFFYSSEDGNNHGINVKIPQISMPPMPDMEIPVSVIIAHTSMRSGLMVENLTAQLGEFFGVKEGKGALVRSVEKGSRGEKAGFRAGDVIVKVNGQFVHDASDFTSELRGSAGQTVTVIVMRDRHEQTLTLTLPEKKDSGYLQEEEDSFGIPELKADTQLAINEAEGEIARLMPDMEQMEGDMAVAAEAQKAAEKGCQEAQKNLKKSLKEMKKSLKDRQLLDQRSIDEFNKKWSEKVSHEMAGDWDEI